MGIGVDIGTSAAKIVAAHRTIGGWKLTGAGRIRIPRSGDPTKGVPGKVVRDALGGRNGRTAAVIGLTGRDVNLQIVQQPRMKPLDYRKMMRYELDQARGEADDLYLDYCTLREPDTYFPQYHAMIAKGKKSFVDERIALVLGAGLDVRDAVPNSFALFAAYRNSHAAEGGTVMLLDLGAENMDMTLVRGGLILFARNISSGAKSFDTHVQTLLGIGEDEAEWRKVKYGNLGGTPGEDPEREEETRPALRTAAGQLAGIVQSSISFAKMQMHEKDLAVDRIYLSGGGARLKGLPEYLQGALKTEVALLDPFGGVDLSAVGEDVRALPTDLAVALGLAQIASVSRDLPVVSIVPDRIRKRRDFFRSTLFLAAAAAVMIVALAVRTVSAWANRSAEQTALDDFRARHRDLQTRVVALDAAESELRQLTARVSCLHSYVNAGRTALDAVARLRKILTDGVYVKRVAVLPVHDSHDRRQDSVLRPHVLVEVPGRGVVLGEILEESEEEIRVAGVRDPVRVAEANPQSILRWEAPVLKVLVAGEVESNVRGGVDAVLRELESQLQDDSRGVSAKLHQDLIKQKPGWRSFEIVLTFR